ncbi:pseudouridine synthase [Bernardetia sp. ABR2-2B]|uniref:pseudouridine synthase n=1 Tax=Bernardetia sp. ABR2-2B TaxID=3127472 RepID=UPI0030D23A3C
MKNNDKKPTKNSAFKPKLKSTEKGNLKSNRFAKAKNKPNPHFEKKKQDEKIRREKRQQENKTTNSSKSQEPKSRQESTKRTEKKESYKNSKNEKTSEDRFERRGKKTVFKKADKKFERPVRVAAKNTSADKAKEKSSYSSGANEIWRLNRYISNSGVCSRREADNLIAKGEISVNGKVVKELGFKVRPTDEVKYKGKVLRKEKPVYVLLNKPKDFITTTSDPKGRKTVMDLVRKATTERIYPVGRLDRNTTGLLLFTNDGEVAKKLSHPSYEVQKIYRVTLDKPFSEEEIEQLKAGLELEDGLAKADGAAILDPDGLSVGIELHMGKNRIVRRMFAHLGYEVIRLDRTVYAGLTKETIGRGQYRLLNEREIIRLRFFNKRGQ